MKNILSKILVLMVMTTLVFSPITGVINKSKAADITSPGEAVGKAVGAAAACFLTIYLTTLAKETFDQAKALGPSAGDVGLAASTIAATDAAVAGVGAAAGAAPMPVGNLGVPSLGLAIGATAWTVTGAAEATIASVAVVGNKQQSVSSLSDSQKCLRDTVVKILGDYVVDQTITWIQGGGKPQFVQDWGSFLQDAVDTGVGEVVSESGAAFLCSPFKLNIQLSLYPVDRFKDKVACTLDGIVGNIDNFMEDFTQGDWIGYGALWSPNNNYFGNILLTYDEASARAAAKKEASKSEASASGGFLSFKTCVQRNQDEIDSCLSSCIDDPYACGIPADTSVESFCTSNATCSKYEASTPGSVVAHMVGNASTWDSQYLAMTQSWVAALSNAVVDRTIKDGLAYMGKSNSPDENVAAATTAATAAIDTTTATDSISTMYNTVQGIKTAVVDNEQQIYDYKKDTYQQLQWIYDIYAGCSGVATASDLSNISDSMKTVNSTMVTINDSYLLTTGGFQIDADQFLPVTTISATDYQTQYNTFVTKYSAEISDAGTGEGKYTANTELTTAESTLSTARTNAEPLASDATSACGKAYTASLATP